MNYVQTMLRHPARMKQKSQDSSISDGTKLKGIIRMTVSS